MENTIFSQMYSFLIYIISGMIIGIFFDIFRILRKTFHTSDVITSIEDIIFWIITGIFLLYILFQISDGEIRIYNIAGLIIGSIIYMLTISKFFIKINVFIVSTIKNIVYKLSKIFIIPIKIFFNIIKKIYTPITFFVINLRKNLLNHTKTKEKNKKISTIRRILGKNVEKYN